MWKCIAGADAAVILHWWGRHYLCHGIFAVIHFRMRTRSPPLIWYEDWMILKLFYVNRRGKFNKIHSSSYSSATAAVAVFMHMCSWRSINMLYFRDFLVSDYFRDFPDQWILFSWNTLPTQFIVKILINILYFHLLMWPLLWGE